MAEPIIMASSNLRDPLSEWEQTQEEIAKCVDCIQRWPGHILQPLQMGEIPNPPADIRLLFVGVAPTPINGNSKGGHFYSSATDLLRGGLFHILEGLFRTKLNGLSLPDGNAAFHTLNCFFLHCAKVRPLQDAAPPIDAIYFCAVRHLKREIQLLRPLAICFLGIGNATPAAKAIFGVEIHNDPRQVSLETWTGWVAVAHQPRRGWKRHTKVAIEQLLKRTLKANE